MKLAGDKLAAGEAWFKFLSVAFLTQRAQGGGAFRVVDLRRRGYYTGRAASYEFSFTAKIGFGLQLSFVDGDVCIFCDGGQRPSVAGRAAPEWQQV